MLASHNSDYAVNFYNDRVKEIIDASIMAEPFTYVPPKAKHMEVVEGNRIVFGNITEGESIVDTDIEAVISYEDIASGTPSLNIDVSPIEIARSAQRLLYPPPYLPVYVFDVTVVKAITLPSRIYESSSYVLNSYSVYPNVSAVYVSNPGDVLADVKSGLSAAMTLKGLTVEAGSPDNQIWYDKIEATVLVSVYEAQGPGVLYSFRIAPLDTAYIAPYGFTKNVDALKCGATHGFGIVYKDGAGRRCSVIKQGISNVYVKFYTEEDGPDISDKINITFKISHRPPDWAETYEIVYFGNLSMDYFLQMRIDSIVDLEGYGLIDHYGANIQATIDHIRELNPRWKVADYVWQKGDRIRLMGLITTPGDGTFVKYDTLYDYEIEETGTAYGEAIGGEYLYFQAQNTPAPFAGQSNIVAEVYRPVKGLGISAAYGAGMGFGIGVDASGNRYHKGDVDQAFDSDGTLVTPAEVINTAHDAYKFNRLNFDNGSAVIHPFWCEAVFSNDWWEWITSNKLTNNGFPFLDDLNLKQTVLPERLRHGGTLITGTRTNNLAHFTFEDFKDFPKKNGPIEGLRQVGFTLKVLQYYKETSIYVNRIQTFNPDGTEQFTLTDAFLGTSRPLETDFGCQHPESVMVNGRNLYFWDHSQGEFIRSAPNGQLTLSGPDYKMSRYFKDTLRWIQSYGGRETLLVNIGANNEFEEVWITFCMGSAVRGLIFSERDGRFKSRIDQISESYVHLGNFFAHLYRQRLWIMNVDEGQDYLSWVGEPVYAEIEVVSNIEPLKNKTIDACAIVSDHELTSESQSIVIPAEASAVDEEMVSNIPVFERKEGVFHGKIMRDENSKGSFATLLAKKLNGRIMRGRYVFLKFKTEEHDEKVRIQSITTFLTDSERNI